MKNVLFPVIKKYLSFITVKKLICIKDIYVTGDVRLSVDDNLMYVSCAEINHIVNTLFDPIEDRELIVIWEKHMSNYNSKNHKAEHNIIHLKEAIALLKCIDNGMDVIVKEGAINHVDMDGVLVTREFIERVNQFLAKHRS